MHKYSHTPNHKRKISQTKLFISNISDLVIKKVKKTNHKFRLIKKLIDLNKGLFGLTLFHKYFVSVNSI